MRVIQTINIENIDYGKPLPMNKKVMSFALDLLMGNTFPPVKVQHMGGKYRLKDGRNRLSAYKLLGKKTIRAYVGVKQDPNPFKPLVCKE
jgi:hypothetical protein